MRAVISVCLWLVFAGVCLGQVSPYTREVSLLPESPRKPSSEKGVSEFLGQCIQRDYQEELAGAKKHLKQATAKRNKLMASQARKAIAEIEAKIKSGEKPPLLCPLTQASAIETLRKGQLINIPQYREVITEVKEGRLRIRLAATPLEKDCEIVECNTEGLQVDQVLKITDVLEVVKTTGRLVLRPVDVSDRLKAGE